MKPKYFTLDQNGNITPEELKTQYRTLSKKLHPDRNQDLEAKANFEAMCLEKEQLEKGEHKKQEGNFATLTQDPQIKEALDGGKMLLNNLVHNLAAQSFPIINQITEHYIPQTKQIEPKLKKQALDQGLKGISNFLNNKIGTNLNLKIDENQ